MKTVKIISLLVLLMVSTTSAVQSSNKTTKQTGKLNQYFVSMPHTHEQCMNMMEDMKGKGDAFLSKFYFGCMSGDHTGYAILSGKDDQDVRNMLPKDLQASAKIEKVDKFTAAQIEQMHKQHAAMK